MRQWLGLLMFFLWAIQAATLLSQTVPTNDVNQQLQAATDLFEHGRTAESKKMLENLLSQLRSKRPSSQLGFVFNSLSKISAATGDYATAIQFARQSADVYRQVGDARGESHSLNNQGIAELQIGKYATAQKTLEAALVLCRRAQDGENEVQVLNNLGSSYYFPGNYSEAIDRYDEAMSRIAQNSSTSWSPYWRQITSFNQATLYQRLGRYENALQIYRQVEQSDEKLTPSDRAHLYGNLGALYRRLGDPYKALDMYRKAQKMYVEQHDAGGELTILKNIGIVYALDMEDLPKAGEIFRSAIPLAQKTSNRREEMQAHLYLGETLFRAGSFSAAKIEFERSRSMASELATTEEEWKSLYGLGRVSEQSGDTSIAETQYRQAVSIVERTRHQLQLSALRSEFFADKREVYDALIGLLFSKDDISDAFSFLERSRARNFQDRLDEKADVPDAAWNLEQVRTALPPSTALLEYWASGNRIGLIWCTRTKSGRTLRTFSLEEMKQIHDLIKAMPESFAGNWQSALGLLSSLLPNDREFLEGIQHLLIVPDGWISYVPFDLLRAPSNSNVVLIEDYDITYLPTAALLHRPVANGRWPLFPWSDELVAFGDPVLTGVTSETSGESHPVSALRFSRNEILDVAKFAQGRNKLFLQQDDRKSLFLSPVPSNALLLHVSTHSFADTENPENSRLLFSPETAGGEPQYVFLRELYDRDLRKVQLATISACDTERGKIIRGEGLQAFSRALLSAGAASTLTTLWRVDDQQTSEFMKQFYFIALQEHRPTAEALRLTKVRFLHSGSKLADPSVWAAFVLNGDGASPIRFVFSWTEVIALSLGSITFIFLTALWLWSRSRIYREQRCGAVVS
jgi:tetratricopeptide (TPR) repeat protein